MNDFISSFTPVLFDWLTQNSIHICIIFGIVLVVDQMSSKRMASFHYWIWLTVFISVIIPPSIKVIIPQTEIVSVLNNFSFISANSSSMINPEIIERTEIQTYKFIVAIIWLTTASAILAYTLISNIFFTPHFSKCTSMAPVELPRSIRDKVTMPVYFIKNYSSPVTTGFFKQSIFIPHFMKIWPGERLSAVIAHELAHIRRHDNLIHLAQLVILSLFFFHPLMWIAYFLSTKYREQAADEFAQYIGISNDSLIDAIVTTVRMHSYQPIKFSRYAHFFNVNRRIKSRVLRLTEQTYTGNSRNNFMSHRAILLIIPLITLVISIDISCSSSERIGNKVYLPITESNLQPNTGAIIGEIYNQVADKPVSRATISLYEIARIPGTKSGSFRGAWERNSIFKQTQTSKQGYYIIKDIPYDNYIFEVILPDSQDISQVIYIEQGSRIRKMNYALTTIPERPGWESVAGRKTLVPVMSNDPEIFAW